MDIEACQGPDGMIGRRLLLPGTSLVLAAERWVPGRDQWWLDGRFVNREWAPAAAEVDLPHGPDDLSGPLPAGDGRLATLAAAIEETRAYLRGLVAGIAEELPWARPFTPDYDREFDRIAEARAAFATLEAMCSERRSLLLNSR